MTLDDIAKQLRASAQYDSSVPSWWAEAAEVVELYAKWHRDNAGYLASHNVGGYRFETTGDSDR